MNRREFLLAAGATGALLRGGPAAAMRGATATPVTVIYDPRYPAARRFAQKAGAPAEHILSTGNDVGQLWFDRLAVEAAAGRLALCGLTTYADFLFLQGCADEAGLHLNFSAMQENRATATLVLWQMASRQRPCFNPRPT